MWEALTKQTKWALYLFAAMAVGVVFAVVGPFIWQRKKGTAEGLPMLPEAIQRKLDQVHEEALAAKVKAKVKAETDKEELEQIAAIEDGAERRRRLAEKLRTL